MASGTTLQLVFEGSSGDAIFVFPYADREVTTATVKTLMNGMIANKVIFENQPIAIKGAKLVTSTETTLNVV